MSQELKKPPVTTVYSSGTTCPKTGLYKATDGKMEFLELVARRATPFQNIREAPARPMEPGLPPRKARMATGPASRPSR